MNPVINTTAQVMNNSKHVKINQEKLNTFAQTLSTTELEHWCAALPAEILPTDEESLKRFLLTFNALSFSYWHPEKWSIKYKEHDTSRGTFSMLTALRRAIDEGTDITNPHSQATLDEKTFAHIMRGKGTLPLMKERLEILNSMGKEIVAQTQGSVSKFLAKKKNALELVDHLSRTIPSFKDSNTHNSSEIVFNKRAQLMVSDLAHFFPESITGIEQLSACADYVLPVVLRHQGILEYSNELEEHIKAKKELAAGSEEEIEIRAATVQAVRQIAQILQVPDMIVNDYLWTHAAEAKKNHDKHRTRTTAY